MKNPVNITLDIYNAYRTNTGRAIKNNGHYNFPLLAQISGARFEDLIKALQWCAENKNDEWAIETIQHFAEALLSAMKYKARAIIVRTNNPYYNSY